MSRRTPARLFDQVTALQCEGLPQAGIARSQRVNASTVSRWLEKAAPHARACEAEHVEINDPVEVQLDELKAYGAGRQDRVWVYNALEVSSRLWLTSQVGPRTLRTTRIFVTAVRDACTPGRVPRLVTSDEFKYHEQTLRRAFGPTAVYVQIDNRYRKNRIVRTRSKLLLRFMCSYLRRRTPAPMRKPRKMTEAIDLLRSFYNFVRPHSSLRLGKVMRTPARQAECFSRALTFRDIFRWVPPPRPESSRAKVNLGV